MQRPCDFAKNRKVTILEADLGYHVIAKVYKLTAKDISTKQYY